MNTLDLVLPELKWQGGIIHQVKEHFNTLDKNQQDSICNVLMDNLKNIVDTHNVLDFMKIRNNNLIVKTF